MKVILIIIGVILATALLVMGAFVAIPTRTLTFSEWVISCQIKLELIWRMILSAFGQR
jgi:hypothetical protein